MQNILSVVAAGRCTGCGACVAACPIHIIRMESDKSGFYTAGFARPDLCVSCGKCEDVCPTKIKISKTTPDSVYYGWNCNEAGRDSGSSGGIFAALAHRTIDVGGAAYGAVLDCENGKLTHKSTDETSLEKLLKSKYLQSDATGSYTKVENDLRHGRSIVFCGTPCQIYGLKHSMKQVYQKLLTVDFICHGVPSPRLFLDYYNDLRKTVGSIDSYDFRSKVDGWPKMRIEIDASGKKIFRKMLLDPYGYLFDKMSISVNPACIQCPFFENHVADLTIADFWGYFTSNIVIPHMEQGVSLVIVNTKKGDNHIKNMKNTLLLKPINKSFAKKVMLKKSRSMENCKAFYSDYQNKGYRFVKKKYASHLFVKLIMDKLKR